MKTILPLRLTATLAALAGSGLLGQTTSPPNAASTDELVVLSPFVVNSAKDTAWTATTTLVGSRTNQELVNVPVTVDVITEEFMKDLGLNNMEAAAQYVAGITVVPRMESRNDNERISYRGQSSTDTYSRNFFLWYVPADTYNVDRFDFNKGSNSLMFGDASPGGQTTIYTKRAREKNFGSVFLSYDSYASHRAQVDVNWAVTKDFFVRFNSVNRSSKTFVDGAADNLRASSLALSYRPFKKTVVRLDLEKGYARRLRADSALSVESVASPGRGFVTNNRWYFTSDGEIIPRTAITQPPTIDTQNSSNAVRLSLLEGQTRGVRLPDGSGKLFSGRDRNFNVLGGANDHLDRTFHVYTITVEQQIGKLIMEAAFNQQFQHQDRNDSSFGTTTSPPLYRVEGSGRLFAEQTSQTNEKVFGNKVSAGRFTAVYPFDFGRFGKQFLVATASGQRDAKTARRYTIANELGTGTLGNNTVIFRAYMEDPQAADPAFYDRFLFKNLPTTATFRPVQFEVFQIASPYYDQRYTRNRSLSLSGEYFGGRLHSLLGVTTNKIQRKIPIDSTYTADATGRFTFPGNPEQNPAAYRYDPSFNMQATSRVAGLTYKLLRGDTVNLNLYGVYSQSFNWQQRQTFWGQEMGPIQGKTKEIGIKGDLFRRKLVYTVAAFDILRDNAAFAWSPDLVSKTALEDLINPNNVLPADPAYRLVTDGLNNERRTVISTEHSNGFEFTLQGQRWHGLQTRLAFASSLVKADRDFKPFEDVLNAAIERTTAALAPGGNPTMAENATVIANAKNVLASNTLTRAIAGRRSVRYNASFVLDYEVPRLRGLRMGVSGVLTPDYIISINNGLTYMGGGTMPLNAYFVYDTKILKRRVTFRLGIDDMYDVINGDSPYRKAGINSVDATTLAPNYTYRYAPPTTVTLSMDAKF